jgi:hypothetical protein
MEPYKPLTSEDVTAWRLQQPPAAKPRRPQPYTPTPEEQAELDAITSTTAKVTRYRAMRDAAQRQGGGG